MAKSIERIKEIIRSSAPCDCSVIYKQGRKRVLAEKCVLSEVYPEIFVVSCNDDNKSIRMTFSYIDVLTKNVCISLPQKGA